MARLYKYITCDLHAVESVLRGGVKFTPIKELNDPSELVPNVIVDEVEASLERLRQDGYTDEDMVHLRRQGHVFRLLAPQHQVIDVPDTKEGAAATIRLPFYDSLSELERRLNDTAATIAASVGVWCLSRRYDSLPMWAHYAGNATGLVFEFADLESVFAGDATGILRQPIPVRYERESRGVTFDPRSHETLFFSKFRDWSYEKEVRVVLPLTDCRSGNNQHLHLFDVPLRVIKSVILGWRMKPESVSAVHKLVSSMNPDVEVSSTQIERGHVQLAPAAQHTVPDDGAAPRS